MQRAEYVMINVRGICQAHWIQYVSNKIRPNILFRFVFKRSVHHLALDLFVLEKRKQLKDNIPLKPWNSFFLGLSLFCWKIGKNERETYAFYTLFIKKVFCLIYYDSLTASLGPRNFHFFLICMRIQERDSDGGLSFVLRWWPVKASFAFMSSCVLFIIHEYNKLFKVSWKSLLRLDWADQ